MKHSEHKIWVKDIESYLTIWHLISYHLDHSSWVLDFITDYCFGYWVSLIIRVLGPVYQYQVTCLGSRVPHLGSWVLAPRFHLWDGSRVPGLKFHQESRVSGPTFRIYRWKSVHRLCFLRWSEQFYLLEGHNINVPRRTSLKIHFVAEDYMQWRQEIL